MKLEQASLHVRQVFCKPYCRGCSVSDFADDLIPIVEYLALLDWVIIVRVVTEHCLLFHLDGWVN